VEKLKLQAMHLVDVPMRRGFNGIVSRTDLLPGGGQHSAIAFGWAYRNDEPQGPNRYWICRLGPDGAVPHWLPESLNQHYAQRVNWTGGTESCNKHIRAFRCGDAVGLLLGLHELQLLDPLSGELRAIPIEGLAADAPWVPLRVGLGHGTQFPVIFASPLGGYFHGFHLALLQIDLARGNARWQMLDNGRPVTLNPDDCAADGTQTAGPRYAVSGIPLIYSAAFRGDGWLFYLGPTHTAHHRGGMPPSALGQHDSDLRLQKLIHQASEDSFGVISHSEKWLIVTPYRKTGPRKGRQTLVNLHDGRVFEPALPRGHAGSSVIDHFDGCWWLTPGTPTDQILVCAEQ
jgi:hypothetical protein